MTGILLFVSTALACLFFIKIGLRPASLIPGTFFLVFLSSIRSQDEAKEKSRQFSKIAESYGLIASRIVIMTGLRGVGQYLGLSTPVSLHGLIGLNIIILSGSILYNYHDGKTIFHVGLRISIISTRIRVYWQYDISTRRQIVRIHIALMTAVYASIYFLLGTFVQTPSSIKEILSLLTHTSIIIILLQTSTNIYHGLFIAQVYITIIYSVIYYIHQRPENVTTQQGVTLQDILEGQKILGKPSQTIQSSNRPQRVSIAKTNIDELSPYTKATLSILNIIIILAMMIRFFINREQSTSILVWEILYWLSILLFIVNFIIIKKVDFYYKIQRVFVFFIINFAIYLSLLNISHLLHRDNSTIALIASVRNIANSIAIFYSQDLFHKQNIKKADYYYRIIANLIAMIINIALITKLPTIAGELRFALIAIYIGIQGYLMYYNLHYINNIDDKEQLGL